MSSVEYEGHPSVPIEVFEVTKVHHKRAWLRQTRWLVIHRETVMKAHVPSHMTIEQARMHPEHITIQPTKVHRISTLQEILIFSKTKLSLRFEEDHPYYYETQDALTIARILTERKTMVQCALAISPGNPFEAMSTLLSNTSTLIEADSDVVRLCGAKMDFITLIRAGGLDGSDDIDTLKSRLSALADPLHNAVALDADACHAFARGVRAELTTIRDNYVRQIMTRQRTLRSKLAAKIEGIKMPKFASVDDATQCVEEALHNLLFDKSVFYVMWRHIYIIAGPSQKLFDDNCEAMARLPLAFFGIRPAFIPVKFDLVINYLSGLERCVSAIGMLNTILAAVKAIPLCVTAYYSLESRGGDAENGTDAKCTADDLVPLLIYLLVRAKTRHLSAIRTFVAEISDLSESSERAYYFTVFSSAVQFVLDWKPEVPPAGAVVMCPLLPHSPFSTPRLLRELSPHSLLYYPDDAVST